MARPSPAAMLKTLAIGGAMATLAACATHHPPPPAARPVPPPSAQAYSGPPTSAPTASVSEAPLPGSERDFVVNVGDRAYFDFDRATIRTDAAQVLAAQAQWLARYPAVRVRIEGNCDERGTREYNLALGARRADAVREFLIEHGIQGGRIATISYGKERPLDPGHDETAWARNRNAHTAITEGAR